MKIGLKIAFIFILCFGFKSAAQVQKDAVFWLSFNVEKKFNKRLSGTFFNQNSFNQNMRELGSTFGDVGLSYKINKNIAIAGNYRFVKARNLDNFYNDVQRFYGDITFSKGYNKFYFQLRSRLQGQMYGLNLFDTYRVDKNFNRNKLIVRYNLNGIYSLHASAEQFLRLNQINKTQAYRFDVGLTYKIDKRNRLDFYYMNQFLVNTKTPRIDFIFGVTYSIKF